MSVIVCGLDDRAEQRSECPNALHNWPLPAGYVEAGEVAKSRLYRKWTNKRCPDCQKFGWIAGKLASDDAPTLTPVTDTTEGHTS